MRSFTFLLFFVGAFALDPNLGLASSTATSPYDRLSALYDKSRAEADQGEALCASQWTRYELVRENSVQDFPLLGLMGFSQIHFAQTQSHGDGSVCAEDSAPALLHQTEAPLRYLLVAPDETLLYNANHSMLTAIGRPKLLRKERRRLGISREEAQELRSQATCVTTERPELLICKYEPDPRLRIPPYFVTYFRKGFHEAVSEE